MIIRLSHLMMKKLHLPLSQTLPPATHPLCDWAAHLYRCERLQYILVTNTTSLASFIIEGRGITNDQTFLRACLASMREYHQHLGMAAAYERWIAPSTCEVHWSKVGNRSVTGSMNQLIWEAQCLQEESGLSPMEVSLELSQTLLSAVAYQRLAKAHRQLAPQTLPGLH